MKRSEVGRWLDIFVYGKKYYPRNLFFPGLFAGDDFEVEYEPADEEAGGDDEDEPEQAAAAPNAPGGQEDDAGSNGSWEDMESEETIG